MTGKKLMGVTVRLPDQVITVLSTPATEVLARQHKLTAHMVKVLAATYGGYPLADMRTFPALVQRGIYQGSPTDGYRLTPFGQDLCQKMFVRVTKP